MFYAMNKLRLSAYLCTPSGPQKQSFCFVFGSVCPFCAFFPIPFKAIKEL